MKAEFLSKRRHAGPYVVLMPVRNEEQALASTIESVVGQSVRPKQLLILDDGSNDRSPAIAREFAAAHKWIQVVSLQDRGFDLVGEGVARVLNAGMKVIEGIRSDYVSKLDADIVLPPEYYKRLLEEMRHDPALGLCAGHPYAYVNGKRLLEGQVSYYPSGTARLYRRSVLDAIGWFPPTVGWDTIDMVKIRTRGFRTRVFHDLLYLHARRTGTRNGYIDGMIRDGRNAYITGYPFVVFLARALYNMRFHPHLLRTCCMLWGYGKAWASSLRPLLEHDELRCHRRILYRRLVGLPVKP